MFRKDIPYEVMLMKRFGVVLCCALTLPGCGMFAQDGLFRNRSDDYLAAREHPVIRVPDGLDDQALGELYAIPAVAEPLIPEANNEIPRPQPLGTSLLEEEIKVQSLGDKRWIWINRAPAEVWPRVRNTLNTNDIAVARAEAAEGVIETVWVEFDDDPGNLHRYRLRMEQGMQSDTTEVSISHAVMPKGGTVVPPWPDSSLADERERTMADFIASGLAGNAGGGQVSLLAQSIGSGAKVEVVAAADAPPYLLLKSGYDRSWASVAQSVSRDEFVLVDQDRTRGLFYVTLKEDVEREKPGFFARMLGAGKSDRGAPLAANYRIELQNTDEGVQVRINSERDPLERTRMLELLKRIRANLA
ncbi:MAG TPA: outer membrane protein assembly factor BamC [Verrucomicrobiae bacterium]|nr:outer membrane protein assembly factor BamC [Verrucomicrobiae bacterium]